MNTPEIENPIEKGSFSQKENSVSFLLNQYSHEFELTIKINAIQQRSTKGQQTNRGAGGGGGGRRRKGFVELMLIDISIKTIRIDFFR